MWSDTNDDEPSSNSLKPRMKQERLLVEGPPPDCLQIHGHNRGDEDQSEQGDPIGLEGVLFCDAMGRMRNVVLSHD